jgi:hypothetical protein
MVMADGLLSLATERKGRHIDEALFFELYTTVKAKALG